MVDHHGPQFAARGQPLGPGCEGIGAAVGVIAGLVQRLCELVGRVGSHGTVGRRKGCDEICEGVA
jgi:hypothetical protein